MADSIEYYFSIGSPWAYLGLASFVEVAERHGLAIEPFPITLIEENGAIYSRNRPPARLAYWKTDLKRWSEMRGRTLIIDNRPALADPTPASFLVIAAALDGLPWIPLTLRLQEAFWEGAADIGRVEVRRAIADAAGLDGGALIAREQDGDVQQRWASNRQSAVANRVFGSPTYRYEGELYWGQDSLGFLERHADRVGALKA